MRTVYKSRISVLMTIILWPSLLIPYVIFIKQLFIDNNQNSITPFIVFSIMIPFIGILLFGIRYIIENNTLIFKIWNFTCGKMEISEILSIERTYFALASNAASLKRLQCNLKKKNDFPFLLLSPNNENQFLDQLKKINPAIEINVKDKKTILNWDF